MPFIPTSGDQGIIKAIVEGRPKRWERLIGPLALAVGVASLLLQFLR